MGKGFGRRRLYGTSNGFGAVNAINLFARGLGDGHFMVQSKVLGLVVP